MTDDQQAIANIEEETNVPRASRPHGFEVFECWGGFLDKNVPNAEHMFDLIDGVRLMIKLSEWQNDMAMVTKIIDSAELAASMGKKIHLVIDCFNRSKGPNDYHTSVDLPFLNRIPRIVGEIIHAFPKLNKLEVFNEPNYCKNKSQAFTVKSYVAYVQAFLSGAAIGNFNGKMVATQTNKVEWGRGDKNNAVHNGWEWRSDCVWDYGNLEGKHSAVLHEETTVDGLVNLVGGGWHRGRAIGWRHPIYESELSPVGKSVSTNSAQGKAMTSEILRFAHGAQLPICLLTWGAAYDGFGHPKWPGEMHYINRHGTLAKGAYALYEFYKQDPPPPPSDDDIIVIEPGEEPPSVGMGYTKRVRRNMKNMTRDQRKLMWHISEEFVE